MEQLPPVAWSELATKADLQAAIRAENELFHAEIRAENEAFRMELRAENEQFHAEIRAENEAFRMELRTEIEQFRESITSELKLEITASENRLAWHMVDLAKTVAAAERQNTSQISELNTRISRLMLGISLALAGFILSVWVPLAISTL